MFRQTIEKSGTINGTGLHTGVKCSITFEPYDREGIYFLRSDIKNSAPIKAVIENVSSTMRGTNLKHGNAEVHTVEHVLSACAALGITDILISMDGPEPPVMDGSSLEYFKALERCGVKKLNKKIPALTVKEPFEFEDKNVLYRVEPADKLILHFVFIHKHPLVSRLEYSVEFNKENYLKEIAPARTFGFEEELEFLKKHGLAKGGSTENAVVVTAKGFSSELRFDGEMVRHKILDLAGDLALTNCSLKNMKIYARGGGHRYNVELARQLLARGTKNE